mmetsp:Transcript_30963/g.22518  ORF Transcript_30963/g.22518 Transcript_30963/m.22518 type:complete len:208 (+) Transcript_30963:1019-1642(+)
MFMYSHIVGASALALEGSLAWFAFGGLTNSCEEGFPCKTQALYNENFLDIPFVGQVATFYPMLNCTAVPILTITLRNNLMQVLPLKDWIRDYGCNSCQWLLQDSKRSVKGVWSLIFSLPCIILVLFFRDPAKLVTYTGGICGTFVIFLIPVTLLIYARSLKREEVYNCENPNKSPFQHWIWIALVLVYSTVTLVCVIIGIVNGTAGE